jgi:hypothetical protein
MAVTSTAMTDEACKPALTNKESLFQSLGISALGANVSEFVTRKNERSDPRFLESASRIRSPSSAPATAALSSFAVTWPPWQKPWRLFAFGSLQVAGNFIEDAIQLGADRGHGGDDHDGYQGSEQCIFDGSSTGLVGEKRRDSMGHDLFLSLLSDVDANRRAIGR